MTPLRPRAGWLISVVSLLGLVLSGMATAGERERFIVFGDSLSDPGNAFFLIRDVEVPPFNLIPDAPYARGGLHFSNGRTWIEQVAADLGSPLSAGPALWKPVLFSNYAVGGSRARLQGAFSLGAQVDILLQDYGARVPDNTRVVLFMGGNDLRDALEAFATDPSGVTSVGIVNAALFSIRDNLLRLQGAGARRFLVANAPNLALVPAVRLQGPAAQGAALFLSVSFNNGLAALLNGIEASLGVQIVRLDVFGILNAVVANPAAAGFTEVERPCITPAVKIKPYCSNPDQFLFWDGIHPTRAGHRVLAGQAAAQLGGLPAGTGVGGP